MCGVDGTGAAARGGSPLVRIAARSDRSHGVRTLDEVVPDVRAGRLRRLRRGMYVSAAHWDGASADEQHRLRALAVAAASDGRAVLSHWSAGAVHGLPLVGRGDDRVHVVRGPATGGRSEGDVARHTYDDPVTVVTVTGARVTGVARTVVDLARLAGVTTGVVAGDHALRTGMASIEELDREVVTIGPGGRGLRAARRTLALVDPRSESPGESVSRVRIDEAGLSPPVLQHVVRDAHGAAGRVDFWWPDHGVVGEFDGRAKYRSADLAVDAAEEVVWQEKLREDRIRATGARVVRWTWQEAWQGEPMVRLLRAAGVR